MKFLKTLGLAAIAAAALMAFAGAGTASATVLCSSATVPCPESQKFPVKTRLEFTLAPGTSLTWVNNGNTLETCTEMVLKTDITNAGSATTTVTGENNALQFNQCVHPNGFTKLGGLEIHNISGTSNGTVTASGEIGWTFIHPVFGSCVYGWKTGGIVGTITEGKPAKLDLNTTIVKLTGSSFACPENGNLNGTLIQTGPASTTLSVAAS